MSARDEPDSYGYIVVEGCQDFFEALWRDPAVADVLKTMLRADGAWTIVEQLVTG